jgi:hypothetical protein
MSKDDDERIWNFILYKFYSTDKKLEEQAPWLIALFVVTIVVIILFNIF